MAHDGHLLKPEPIQQGEQIGGLGRVAHFIGVKGGAVVAQIDADDPVLFAQRARQQTEVVEAAEQPVDQYDGLALALLLEVQ